MTDPVWRRPDEIAPIGINEVHVWKNVLRQDAGTTKFFDILSEQERQKALRFYFERDRLRYIAAHAALRLILGKYMGRDPKSLSFCANRHGKPCLCPDKESPTALLFNISHSHNLSVVAVSPRLEIGVDIEYMKRDIDIIGIASRFFSQKEIKELRSMPEEMQQHAFFRCWTRKEAYLKGKGRGLSAGLDRFEVSLLPSEPPAVVRDDALPEGPNIWRLFDMPPSPGYAGALAVQGEPAAVRYLDCGSILTTDARSTSQV